MRVRSLNVTNFKCFGPSQVVLELGDLTVLIGGNGAGKSAALEALTRLFGVTLKDRTVTKEDFHVPAGMTLESSAGTSLRVEVVLEPEAGESAQAFRDQAAAFGQMIVAAQGGAPYLRAVLEASWVPGPTAEGTVDARAFWALTNEPDVPEDKRQTISAGDRSQILVHYVPASRDPERQLRNVAGALLHRVFRAVEWGSDLDEQLTAAAAGINSVVGQRDGMKLFNAKVGTAWEALHPSKPFGVPELTFLGLTISEALGQARMMFSSGPTGTSTQLDRLSDGQRSLFYLSLIGAVFDLECEVMESAPSDGSEPEAGSAAAAVSPSRLGAPLLSVFAIEEPENHLSPHYLGRIAKSLRTTSESPYAQVLITTHSPSIMRRVRPEEVRHIRLAEDRVASAKPLSMPEDDAEAAKFLREAVIAFPELYFADLVVLGEGPSEEIVLPRLLAAADVDPDPMRVSVVPLGGRFVHHFWRLLNGLQIPTVTLLDLDAGRRGGPWGRLKHAYEQLAENGLAWDEMSKGLKDVSGAPSDAHDLSTLHRRTDEHFKDWVSALEKHGVFFSCPLDLDFAMLKAFPEAYKGTTDADPSLPEDEPDRTKKVDSARRAVFKKGAGDGYSEKAEELFPWYEELFLSNSKPATHLRALSSLDDEALRKDMPRSLTRLVAYVKDQLGND